MLMIIKKERDYWIPLMESKNKLLARVARLNLADANRKQIRFSRLTKTVSD